jgi:hypothetical protein
VHCLHFGSRTTTARTFLDLYGRFLNLGTCVSNVLERMNHQFPQEQTEFWWEQLRQLQQRVEGFDIITKFYKPVATQFMRAVGFMRHENHGLSEPAGRGAGRI